MVVTLSRLFLTAGVAIDGDDPDHIKWILDKSLERASEFNITGITYRLTQGKFIIIIIIVVVVIIIIVVVVIIISIII